MGHLSTFRAGLEDIISETTQVGKELDDQGLDLHRSSAQFGAEGEAQKSHEYQLLAQRTEDQAGKLKELVLRLQELHDTI